MNWGSAAGHICAETQLDTMLMCPQLHSVWTKWAGDQFYRFAYVVGCVCACVCAAGLAASL